ncbi:hypothetical protein QTA58_20680 [Neorhizobium sp. CSC1952]|uniref:DUF6894 family protein n=1 Tax=Neorhizobium sp. CSC1952 TaxID=2978974 RepID=UPI0025A5B6A8|nr:hypothetical protein [Rhizobium sp. CSC1952]WJR66599.1 hypothetical protein QTA58_20680 [Rhizobium sp. CSC1952]
MARYFFDLVNGSGLVRDEQGLDVSTREEITREVSRILVDIASEELPGTAEGAIGVTVRDERGRAVLTGNLSFETRWHDDAEVDSK